MNLTKQHLPALLERLESAIGTRDESANDLSNGNYTDEDAKLLFEVDLFFDNIQVSAMKAEILKLSTTV